MVIEPLPSNSRRPAHIKESLDNLASTLGLASVDHLELVFEGWADIVGEAAATNCEPIRLEAGTLHIRTYDQGWATELKWMGQLIARRCNDVVGDTSVTDVSISLRPR